MLYCAANKRATKRFTSTPTGVVKEGFDAGKWFGSSSWEVADIQTLSQRLTFLEKEPQVMVIRGALRPEFDQKDFILRRNSHFQTPRAGRCWILIDIDKIRLPAGLSLSTETIQNVLQYVISLLPPEFREVSFHWQFSSSAGVGDPTVVSLHLWFWLARPIPDDTLKMWGKHVNAKAGMKLIDTALFQAVQSHFTAAPLFVGMDDPFPVRSGLISNARHEVALVLPNVSTEARSSTVLHTTPKTGRASHSIDRDTVRGFDDRLSCIGDHASGDGFHDPIIRAIASFVGENGKDNVDAEWLYETVSARILSADASKHDPAYVAHMASREHIMPALQGAIAKYGEKPARTRAVKGAKPHFTGKAVSVTQAQARLRNIIDKLPW